MNEYEYEQWNALNGYRRLMLIMSLMNHIEIHDYEP